MTDGVLVAPSTVSEDQPLRRVVDYVNEHASAAPGSMALVGSNERLTYAQLQESVTAHARALLAHGVRPGDRVGFMSSPRPEFVVSYLATTAIGAIWLGLNPRYSARELGHVLSDATPVLLFSTLPEGERSALEEAAAGTVTSPVIAVSSVEDLAHFGGADEELSVEDVARAEAAVDTQDPAIIVYTSGSTGVPKGAQLRHSGLVRLGRVEGAVWDLTTPVVLCNLPINHIGCVGDLLGVPLVRGGTVVLRETFHAEEVLRDIETERISALFQIPTQLQRISAHPGFESRDISSLKLVGWGGSPLPSEALGRYRAKGVRLISTYGLTEATCSVTYSAPDATDEELLNTVGRPDPEMDVRLLGETGTWLAEGEGEVCVRNDTVMAGYLNMPDATAEAFTADGWLRTGDIGSIREDGNLVLVGRTSDMYKSGGYNIYPREIEQVIEDHEQVVLAAVVARPDPEFHEVGVAFVELAPGSALDEGAMRSWCRERLANFKVPKEFVVLDELPLLPVGKIDKKELRASLTPMGRIDV